MKEMKTILNTNSPKTKKPSIKSEDIQNKIFTIQKYQNSPRFSEYLKKNCGIKYSITQLEKMKEPQLSNVLDKIRINLDNRNMDHIYNTMAKTMANGLEMTVSPFYNIDGFSDTLLNNEEFLDVYEKFKIEYKLPTMPVGLQLGYIITSTMLIQHKINETTVGPTEYKQVKEMKPPDVIIPDKEKKKKKIKQTDLNVGSGL